MKNKKVTYILLPLALLVWGIIIYRIIAPVTTDSEAQVFTPTTIVNNDSKDSLSDVFSIHPTYRDPFLGHTTQKKTVEKKPVKKATPKVVLTRLIWPKIVYGGLIKNKKTKQKTVLITVNGIVQIVKAGDVFNDITLLKVQKDSITVQYQNERKFIKK